MAHLSHTFSPPDLELLNQIIPGYEFEQFLAQGGMGAVYLAKHQKLQREVAVKVLPLGGEHDDEFRSWFLSEARTMAKLTHPNLVVVFDYGEVEGFLYIVMEYVAGVSLYELAVTQGLEVKESVSIIRDVALGLFSAHQLGILHRDVKPANILMTPSRQPKLGDFGLAQEIEYENLEEEQAANAKSLFGTPAYLAPEAWGNAQIDGRSDLYSLGVVLYELLVGKLPKDNNFLMPSDCINIDAGIDDIIAKAVHPDPNSRYPDAEAFANALDQWLNFTRTRPIALGEKHIILPIEKKKKTFSRSTPTALVRGGIKSSGGSQIQRSISPVIGKRNFSGSGVSVARTSAQATEKAPKAHISVSGQSVKPNTRTTPQATKVKSALPAQPVLSRKASVSIKTPTSNFSSSPLTLQNKNLVKVKKEEGVNAKVLILGLVVIIIVFLVFKNL